MTASDLLDRLKEAGRRAVDDARRLAVSAAAGARRLAEQSAAAAGLLGRDISAAVQRATAGASPRLRAGSAGVHRWADRAGTRIRAAVFRLIHAAVITEERLLTDAAVLCRRAGAAYTRLRQPFIGAAATDGSSVLQRFRPVLQRFRPVPGRFRLRLRHVLAATLLLAAGGIVLYGNCGFDGCPDVERLTAWQPGGAPSLLDRHGEKFADLAPYERTVVELDSLPPHVANAFIAVEDRRFWRHRGVDWPRVLGAALANVRARSVTQGSSTVPMQLARNVFPRELPGSERTFRRKLQEARVAQLIERRFTKAEILEMYLNHIYFGGGAYGIEAAARLYFDKSSTDLTLPEAATLAALPKAPAHYDPRRRADRSTERRNLVLSLMQQQQMIDADEADEARGTELAAASNARDVSSVPVGAYFIDIVRDALEDRFGEELYRSRLRIHTTIDAVAQHAVERELRAQLESLDGRVRSGPGELQGAMVIMDAATGDVIALAGGRDAATSRYNRAVLGRRQVGSAFKPFVFATALQEGIPTSQLVLDAPLRMQLSRNDVWQPENYDGMYEGEVSLRHALVRSRNVPTVRLASAVGIDDVARMARAAGVTAAMDETPALALGTVAMSPLQLATAYTTFATLGTTAWPRFIMRVEDEAGTVLWQNAPNTTRSSVPPAVAYIVTDILRDAIDYGTGTGVRTAGYRGVAAGKTGTTNNATDAWFVGYTPDLVGAVWIGYDRPSPLGSAATGGGFAAPVFGRVMREVYGRGGSRSAPADWAVPAGVAQYRVDPWTGYVLQDGCEPRGAYATSELFVRDHLPPTSCPYRDWWGGLWDRLGDVFRGRDRDRDRDRGGPLRGRGGGDERDSRDGRDLRIESEPPGSRQPSQGPQPSQAPRPPGLQRSDQMDEFLRARSERLRRAGNGG